MAWTIWVRSPSGSSASSMINRMREVPPDRVLPDFAIAINLIGMGGRKQNRIRCAWAAGQTLSDNLLTSLCLFRAGRSRVGPPATNRPTSASPVKAGKEVDEDRREEPDAASIWEGDSRIVNRSSALRNPAVINQR